MRCKFRVTCRKQGVMTRSISARSGYDTSVNPIWDVTESHSHQDFLCGLGGGQLSLSDVMLLQSPYTHTGRQERGHSGIEKKRGGKKRWARRQMVTGISAGREEGVVVWCICCHGVDSHTRLDERGFESSRAEKQVKRHKICLVDLLIASRRVIYFSRSLKVATRLSEAERRGLCAQERDSS